MAMVESVIATELENLVPTLTETNAVIALSQAYGVYASDAVGNAVPINSAGIDLGKAAMEAALVGMSSAGAGIVKIPTAIAAFWVAVAAGLSVSFTGAIAITPPPHTNLPTTFAALMPANTAGGVTLEEAAEAMAAIIHPEAILGGTVTLVGPSIGPII